MPIIYNDSLSLLFVHIPKCGGTSVELTLAKNNFKMTMHDSGIKSSTFKFWKCSPQHYHLSLLNSFISSSLVNRIAVVRSPYDRIVSEYVMRNKNVPTEKRLTFTSWFEIISNKYKANNFILDNHIRPQVEFVDDSIKVFKLEDGLDSVFEYLISLGFDLDTNKNSRIKHRIDGQLSPKDIILSDTDKNNIYSFYHLDFKTFDYEKY